GDGLKYSAEKGFQEAFSRFLSYITQSPFYLKTALFILFIIGLISFYKLIIGFDLVVKRKEKSLNPYLFLLLWILIPLLYFSFLFHVFDPRYLLSIFPAIFIIAGVGAMIIYDFIKDYDKRLALTIILFILLFAGYQQGVFAQQVIESRANSFVQFRYAGEWMKLRTNPNDIIFNTGVPQNTYYTERETFGHGSEENFNKILKEGRIKYFVVSRLEIPPEWVFSYPQRNPDKLRIVYACDNSVCSDNLAEIDRNSITLIVYEIIAF
ncbi:hypothetical protein HYX17_00175, partial [Candidatus Woesearchaeota archaeon]|nr:hypothetical protein [Candidatus Woesearchaeota archaeon]